MTSYQVPGDLNDHLVVLAKRRQMTAQELLIHIVKEWLRFRIPPSKHD
jgi:hypothetical protein